MAIMGDIPIRGDMTDAKHILSYLRQLEEQVRYVLQNLDGDNIRAGAVGESQLSSGVNTTLRTLESQYQRTREALSEENVLVRQALSGLATRPEALTGSLPFKISVSGEQPSGTGILWIKPGTPDNGVAACTVSYIGEE